MKGNKDKRMDTVETFLKGCYAREFADANVQQLHGAVAKAVLCDRATAWNESRNAHAKRCGYFSAEFLIGRLVYANLFNLGLLKQTEEMFAAHGASLSSLEEIEDAALGNGGLGRLAACFLESAASKDIPLDGYGIYYRYGLFRQKFENGFQAEYADDWLRFENPWAIRREEECVTVHFADGDVLAVPYDTPVFGYRNGVVNTLRLWSAEPVCKFCFDTFDEMRGEEQAKENFFATRISDVLYPNDSTEEGKLLRLRQEYFLVSASLQSVFRQKNLTGERAKKLPDLYAFQLNDTHPVLAVVECVRLLIQAGLEFEEAFSVCRRTFHYTNHTVMSEALERWNGKTLRKILPNLWEIVVRLEERLQEETGGDERYFIVKDDVVYMANLALYVCEKVNGVAKLHTDILREKTFANWQEKYPEKIVNVTNGITPRRWLMLNNPGFSAEITARIGDGWTTDLEELSSLKKFVYEKKFRERFCEIRRENKRALAEYIRLREKISLDENFIFDVQIKRLHEYKRQLLNAFSVLYLYYEIKEGRLRDFKPTAFLFGAKAAPAYERAKAIIKYINEIAKKVNGDKSVADKLKVVFVQNYDVSYAEKMVCAADVSEQISTVGLEASGTGNMKFMLNGTVTLGTEDGANVEIFQAAGKENNYPFGCVIGEVEEVKKSYKPADVLRRNPRLKRVVETLVDGTFDDGDMGMLKGIYDSLLKGETPDKYLVLYDFEDYVRAKLDVNRDYGTEEYVTKCLLNTCAAGRFSADRAVQEYAEKIWKL